MPELASRYKACAPLLAQARNTARPLPVVYGSAGKAGGGVFPEHPYEKVQELLQGLKVRAGTGVYMLHAALKAALWRICLSSQLDDKCTLHGNSSITGTECRSR